jgi:hypothetical protein
MRREAQRSSIVYRRPSRIPARRLPAFHTSPHDSHRQYEAAVTILLVVWTRREPHAGHRDGLRIGSPGPGSLVTDFRYTEPPDRHAQCARSLGSQVLRCAHLIARCWSVLFALVRRNVDVLRGYAAQPGFRVLRLCSPCEVHGPGTSRIDARLRISWRSYHVPLLQDMKNPSTAGVMASGHNPLG